LVAVPSALTSAAAAYRGWRDLIALDDVP
jgi:hypothetical protein